MHKLDLNIARLKLLLAELGAKKEALLATRRQYQEQIDRLVSVIVHEGGTVERTLAMMLDVDARLQDLARQEHYLDVVYARARRELDSLQLTKLIEETRAELAALRLRQIEQDGDTPDTGWMRQEIRRLEEIITVASDAAARSISSGL